MKNSLTKIMIGTMTVAMLLYGGNTITVRAGDFKGTNKANITTCLYKNPFEDGFNSYELKPNNKITGCLESKFSKLDTPQDKRGFKKSFFRYLISHKIVGCRNNEKKRSKYSSIFKETIDKLNLKKDPFLGILLEEEIIKYSKETKENMYLGTVSREGLVNSLKQIKSEYF